MTKFILIENSKIKRVGDRPNRVDYSCEGIEPLEDMIHCIPVFNPTYNQPTGEKRDIYDPESGIATFEDVLDEREVLLLERPKTAEEIETERKTMVVAEIRKTYTINDELSKINRAFTDAKDNEYTTYRAVVQTAKDTADTWAVAETKRSAELQKDLDNYTIVTGPKPVEETKEQPEDTWTAT